MDYEIHMQKCIGRGCHGPEQGQLPESQVNRPDWEQLEPGTWN